MASGRLPVGPQSVKKWVLPKTLPGAEEEGGDIGLVLGKQRVVPTELAEIILTESRLLRRVRCQLLVCRTRARRQSRCAVLGICGRRLSRTKGK